MPRTLFRDLTTTQQAGWYDGSPPGLLEVSVAGLASDAAPAIARDGHDLLSVVQHEIGHTIGLSDAVAGFETNDLDFDINPVFVGGTTTAVAVADSGDRSHLAAARTLKFPAVIPGIRRLPSQTDVFAAAAGAGAGWTSLDLPRQDFLSGSSWNRPGNWLGNRAPDEDDDAFIRHGGSTTVQSAATVNNLTVAQASLLSNSVTTLNADLQLSGTAIVQRGARLAGMGNLVITSRSRLGLENGVSLDVKLVNSGPFDTNSIFPILMESGPSH